MSDSLTILRPDDWHLHLRDNAGLASVIQFTAERCGRAIVMPNLKPPVTTVELALAYRRRILEALPKGSSFSPLMTLYLTDRTTRAEIEKASSVDGIAAVKLYPAGATTNSESGVTDLELCHEALEAMQELGIPLLVHGEVTSDSVDIFERERAFIEHKLIDLLETYPKLKVVFEHITTKDAVEFVLQGPENLAATITAHHLLLNRNDMLVGGIRPHYYCLPILKHRRHQEALVEAATSGSPKFFLGTDSAPHTVGAKESACGCAGVFSAHGTIELYAEVFDQVGALDKLERFASKNGPAFYGLSPNVDTITLVKEPWGVPDSYPFGDSLVRPFRAGGKISWRIVGTP